ncbi:MAG: phosphoglucomutase/phosphomannomutase alpha/beta/alpha domain [Clostridia bacterium]|jgi:phosphomannomutase/phosphoglucomutase|nr:phosphoglucomutase/phosphomannomutase alpha/beta/alpha domain [Clostridia bacterium]
MNLEVNKNINPQIYRGYDIRAIYGVDLDESVAYTIGLGFGSYIQDKGYTKCVIGQDNRTSGVSLTNALIQGITETGVDVTYIGLVTTPMYYFAQKELKLDPGIMVTASHNPKEYNGFKMAFDDFGNACGELIQDFRRFVEAGNFKKGNGTVTTDDIRDRYLELIKKSIDLGDKKIKVVVDSANGTTSIIAKEAFEMMGVDLIPLYIESNPEFPNHHPDPSVEKNNEDLKRLVLENHADLGIGLDGDGDRVGIIDEKGNMIYIDLYAIIIWRDIMSKISNKSALFDVKCTKALPDEIIKLGGSPVCYRTGNSYMKAKMREGKFAFGSELSGHVFFNDKWPNIDDGIYAGLRLIEILSKTDKTVSQLLEGINKYYATPELKFKSTDEEKFKVIEKIKEYCIEKGYNINTIDGVRAEFADGWALVRASNTGPDITARFEAITNERAKKLEEEFMSLLK